MAEMAKKGGSRNRVLDDRLWDALGREWRRTNDELSREEIGRLLRRDDVQVGVHTSRSVLRWVAPKERQKTWAQEIEPNFHDRPDYRPPDGAPGQASVPWHSVVERN